MIGRDVVPPLSDDVQLTVEEYRNRLYEVRRLIVEIQFGYFLPMHYLKIGKKMWICLERHVVFCR